MFSADKSKKRDATGLHDTYVILIGCSDYAHGFRNIPCIKNNLEDLYTVITDKRCIGIPPQQVFISLNEPADTIKELLFEKSRLASGILIIYYAGYGFCAQGNNLYLGAANSKKLNDAQWLNVVEHDFIRTTIIKEGAAKKKILLLDVCHNGDAAKLPIDVTDEEDDACLHVSSCTDEASYFNSAERNSFFTGTFLESVKGNIDCTKQSISLKDIFEKMSGLAGLKKMPANDHPGDNLLQETKMGIITNSSVYPHPSFTENDIPKENDVPKEEEQRPVTNNITNNSAPINISINKKKVRIHKKKSSFKLAITLSVSFTTSAAIAYFTFQPTDNFKFTVRLMHRGASLATEGAIRVNIADKQTNQKLSDSMAVYSGFAYSKEYPAQFLDDSVNFYLMGELAKKYEIEKPSLRLPLANDTIEVNVKEKKPIQRIQPPGSSGKLAAGQVETIADYSYLENTLYQDLAANKSLKLFGVRNNTISFQGKLCGYTIVGTARIRNKKFTILSGNATGSFFIFSDDNKLSGNILIESITPCPIDLEKNRQ